MLHDNEVSLILEWNTKIRQEGISWLAHNHGAEKLASEPSSSSWGDGSFDDGDLEIWTSLAKHVCSAKTARSSTNDDDVGLGVGVEIIEVATSHGTRDLGLADWSERKALLPLVGQLFESLGFRGVDSKCLEIKVLFQWNAVDGSGGLGEHC